MVKTMAEQANVRHDPKSLLETATSASEKVAVLYFGFMVVCAYLLVIVFGTTHLAWIRRKHGN